MYQFILESCGVVLFVLHAILTPKYICNLPQPRTKACTLNNYSFISTGTVIEADSLLETEVETLAEALESANNAVLSTISMISIMMSVSFKSFHAVLYMKYCIPLFQSHFLAISGL
jgi:hypothetical protein